MPPLEETCEEYSFDSSCAFAQQLGKYTPNEESRQLVDAVDFSFAAQPCFFSPNCGTAGLFISVDAQIVATMLAECSASSAAAAPGSETNTSAGAKSFRISFGMVAVETWSTMGSRLSSSGQTVPVPIIVAQAPTFADTQWPNKLVPVQAVVVAGEKKQNVELAMRLGMFRYNDEALNPSVFANVDNGNQQFVMNATTGKTRKMLECDTQTSNKRVKRASISSLTPPLTPSPCGSPSSPYVFEETDFQNVIRDWNIVEVANGRRIVLIHKVIELDGKITIKCRTVGDEDFVSRGNGDILISCIYWQDEQQFFVSGVDIIYAIEGILDRDYTTEEKNRIRRNMEKFEPRTISKNNEKYFQFFWTLMSYGEPRPRNIEANVKVYPWTLLTVALSRVLDKFGPIPLKSQSGK